MNQAKKEQINDKFDTLEHPDNFTDSFFMASCVVSCHKIVSEDQMDELMKILNTCGGFFYGKFDLGVTTHLVCDWPDEAILERVPTADNASPPYLVTYDWV